jgi:outer membrane protein assembly factor BamB
MTGRYSNHVKAILSSSVLLALAGCGATAPSLPELPSIFGKADEAKLPGTRIAVLNSSTDGNTTAAESSEPVVLPAVQQNASWSQPGGAISNAPGHLAFSGNAKKVWSSDIGAGSSSDGKIISLPIISGGKVFTLDSEGQVSAFSMAGQRIWRTDLTPEEEKSASGFGGGLAAEGDKIFAATGFGTVIALSTSNGKVLWTKSLGVPIRSSPTVSDGKLFVVNTESELYALATATGDEVWRGRGLPEGAATLSNVSPAVSGDTLVVTYPSGEVVALDVKNGQPRWSDSVSSGLGASLTSIGDASRPVIEQGVVFAGSRSGRLVATQLKTGERVWSRDIQAAQTPWVAGDNVFVVDTGNNLYALGRKDGKIRWAGALPKARTWSGPTLAGGKLWLASNEGLLIGVDAKTGKVVTQRELDDPIFISPVVASGRMFVLTDDAELIAMN